MIRELCTPDKFVSYSHFQLFTSFYERQTKNAFIMFIRHKDASFTCNFLFTVSQSVCLSVCAPPLSLSLSLSSTFSISLFITLICFSSFRCFLSYISLLLISFSLAFISSPFLSPPVMYFIFRFLSLSILLKFFFFFILLLVSCSEGVVSISTLCIITKK